MDHPSRASLPVSLPQYRVGWFPVADVDAMVYPPRVYVVGSTLSLRVAGNDGRHPDKNDREWRSPLSGLRAVASACERIAAERSADSGAISASRRLAARNRVSSSRSFISYSPFRCRLCRHTACETPLWHDEVAS